MFLKRKKHLLFIFGILTYVFFVMSDLVRHHEENFWDFKIYYHAASNEITDPYDAQELFNLHHDDSKILAFKYPPLVLYFFKPFTALDYTTALYLFIGLLLVSSVLLVVLWGRMFKTGADPWYYLFLTLAFNASFYLALRSGNVSIFTALLIWVGLYFYVQKKYVKFCILILAASFFKLTPIFFVLMLLSSKELKVRTMSFYSIFILAGYVLLNFILFPVLGMGFFNGTSGMFQESGIINPNLYAFYMELSGHLFGTKLNLPYWDTIGKGFYLVSAASLLFFSYKFLESLRERGVWLSKRLFVVLMVPLYLLILPRVKDYDYVLLIPVAYYIIRHVSIKPFFPLLILCVVSSTYAILPGVRYVYQLMWDYYPLIVAFGLWLLFYRLEEIKMKVPKEDEAS